MPIGAVVGLKRWRNDVRVSDWPMRASRRDSSKELVLALDELVDEVKKRLES